MAPTAAQLREYNLHRNVCVALGAPQVTLAHKGMKGTETPQSTTGNIIYKGPGPVQSFTPEYQSQTPIWWANMPFLRGEEREEDFGPGIITVQLLQGQFPAIDDNGNVLTVAEDDFVIDSDGVTLWRIVNPVLSPENSYWTCMLERQR